MVSAVPCQAPRKLSREQKKLSLAWKLNSKRVIQFNFMIEYDIYIYDISYIYIIYIISSIHIYLEDDIYIYIYVGMRDDISEDRRYIEKTGRYNPVDGSEIRFSLTS